MGRPKGSKNKKPTGITYPRKCLLCDYISNNPSMYHYHTRTHQEIPVGKLCDHGCNQQATTITTNGTFICAKTAQQCPKYLSDHSSRVKEQWENSDLRKEQTKQSFIKRLHNRETVEKQIKTKREKSGTFSPEKAKEFRYYARYIRARSQQWARDQGIILGRQGNHVDHKFSILDSWKNNLLESIVNHPANLQILNYKENSQKGSKSTITLEELMNLICEQLNKSS